MAAKRRFKDDENESMINKRLNSKHLNESNDEVDSAVRAVLDHLIQSTHTELDGDNTNEFINQKSTTTNQNDSTTNELDDSFKLNYDFSLLPNDALYNQFDNSFTETTISSIDLNNTPIVLNRTSNEHNYANVPTSTTTSSTAHHLSSHSNMINSSRSIKSALRRQCDTNQNRSSCRNKKNVKFKGVTVFYFPRNQGGSTVPSQGGSTLGMEMTDCGSKNFTLDAHQEEKRQVHREILLRQKRYDRIFHKQQQARLSNSNLSDSDDDSLENMSDISDSELDFDSWFFLQPVPVKQRRALLRESGITKIDSSEKEECRDIRLSREFCGCECRVYCDPETCQCSLNGIKCQMDRLQFPCGCTMGSCNNINGRTEFNPMRFRTHFVHTMMRLELEGTEIEKKNENQPFNDNSLNSSVHHHQHIKTDSSSTSSNSITTTSTALTTATATNIEIMNQNTLFSPINSNQAQTIDQQYELKFTTNSSIQPNEIYQIESSNTSNILNCNEAVNLPNNNYTDLYDSSDTGSSSYSENSDCTTSDDLDNCGGLITTDAFSSTINTANCLTFGNLSPFSLISSVPATNADLLINSSTALNYDNQNYHQTSTIVSNNFLSADQSFRYYTSSLNNLQNDQMLTSTATSINSTLSHDHQLINNHQLNSYYYPDANSLYGNLATTVIGNDCYTTVLPQINTATDHHLTTMTVKSQQTSSPSLTVYTDLPQPVAASSIVDEQPFIETHYTDLSQSIASKSSESLFATNNSSINHHFILDSDPQSNVVVNSSDDSSCSGQSNIVEDNAYLTSGESTQNEDNFGEIIKNTIHGVESVAS